MKAEMSGEDHLRKLDDDGLVQEIHYVKNC